MIYSVNEFVKMSVKKILPNKAKDKNILGKEGDLRRNLLIVMMLKNLVKELHMKK